MSDAIETYVFEHKGKLFCARVFTDENYGKPWEEYDGHGVIWELKRGERGKEGEIVLYGGFTRRYAYDWDATLVMAERDGWNAELYDAPDRFERAVNEDLNRMRGWLTGEWYFVGIGVCQVAENGELPMDDYSYYTAALWGIESDSGNERFQRVMRELADDLIG